MVGNGAGQLEIAVGDGAAGVTGRLKRALDHSGKRSAPKEGVVVSPRRARAVGEEEDAPHAGARGVAGADGRRKGGNCLGDGGGPVGKFGGEPAEIVKEVVDGGREAKAVVPPPRGGVLEGSLQRAEQATCAGKGQDHGAEFAEELVPGFGGDAREGAGERGEKRVEASEAMGREGDRGIDGINNPPQDQFAGGPSAIPFAELLLGGRFLSVRAVPGFQRPEDPIKRVEEVTFDAAATGGVALDDGDEVVNVDVGEGDRSASVLAGERTGAVWSGGNGGGLQRRSGAGASGRLGRGGGRFGDVVEPVRWRGSGAGDIGGVGQVGNGLGGGAEIRWGGHPAHG